MAAAKGLALGETQTVRGVYYAYCGKGKGKGKGKGRVVVAGRRRVGGIGRRLRVFGRQRETVRAVDSVCKRMGVGRWELLLCEGERTREKVFISPDGPDAVGLVSSRRGGGGEEEVSEFRIEAGARPALIPSTTTMVGIEVLGGLGFSPPGRRVAVVVVEKDSVFERIVAELEREPRGGGEMPLMVVTGAGYPSLGTRMFLRSLDVSTVYVATDGDPWGAEIAFQYVRGSAKSERSGMEGVLRTRPGVEWVWLGIDVRDDDVAGVGRIPFSARGAAKARGLVAPNSRFARLSPASWVERVQVMVDAGSGVELDGLGSYLGYIRARL